MNMSSAQTRMNGTNPGYVGGQTKYAPNYSAFGGGAPTVYETSYWELHCDMQDGAGDGTVPKSSGAAPVAQGGAHVNEQFQISGIEHEPTYKSGAAQITTLYAITKILGQAKMPA